jgi:hypothetical protein
MKVPEPGSPSGSRQLLQLSGDTSDHAYGVWFYDTGCTALNWATSFYIRDDGVGDLVLCTGNNGGPLGYYWYWEQGFGPGGYVSTGVVRSIGWHYFEFRATSSDIQCYVDGTYAYTGTVLDPTALDSVFTLCYREYPNPSYFDDAIIRNWVTPEPSPGTWGIQEGTGTTSPPPIPGFPFEAVALGLLVALGAVVAIRRRQHRPRKH